MDHLNQEKRSWNMSRIKSKDTSPEILVRKYLYSKGMRYRLYKRLPGKPDITIEKYKTVIFIHGCFWHHHKGCKRSNIPKSNTEYWENKIQNNIMRDERNQEKLIELGYKVLTIWECECKNIEILENLFNSIST